MGSWSGSGGFLVSAVVSPIVGRVMDARGPRVVILIGIALMSSGLLLAPWVSAPWHLYATLGVAVGGGANMMTYTVHSQFLPNWFVRRRSLAISIAFAGAGVGAILLLPWLQRIILNEGWRLVRGDGICRSAGDHAACHVRQEEPRRCRPASGW